MVKKTLSIILIVIGVFFALLPHTVHVALGFNLPHIYHVGFGLVAGAIGAYLMFRKKKQG